MEHRLIHNDIVALLSEKLGAAVYHDKAVRSYCLPHHLNYILVSNKYAKITGIYVSPGLYCSKIVKFTKLEI